MFAFGPDGVGADKSPAARVKLWKNVPLTPDRIPSFIIPPKLHLNVSPRLTMQRDKESDEQKLLPLSSPEKPSPGHQSPLASPRLAVNLRFTPLSKRKRAKEDLLDPSSRAAMSLEHVKKITTPYGFRTLAASPHLGRRESLFHKKVGSSAEEGSPTSAVPHYDSPTPGTARPRRETCSPAQTPVRRRLKVLLRSPRSVLRHISPSPRKKRSTKTQEL